MRQDIVDETGSLLSEQAPPEWPLSLEETCRDDGVLLGQLYSVFTFELF